MWREEWRALAPADVVGQCPPPFQRRRALASHRIRFGLAAIGLFAASTAFADPLPAKLTIASEGARPPYNYFDGDKLAGFEIDLGQDLCRRMKRDCEFVSQTWDDMIPDLLTHSYDAIMAAMEINAQREKEIAFSIPYVRLPSAFLVQKASDLRSDDPDALAGRKIGVEQGGPHLAFVTKTYPGAEIRRYATLGDAILDLEAGRVDVALGDKDAIVTFLQTRRDGVCCRILADVPRVPAFFGEGIGVGLRKEDIALKAAFDTAITESMADGTFARIAARYFSFPINGPAAGRVVEQH